MADYELVGPVVTRFGECSPEMIQAIRSCFQQWGKHHMTKPDSLGDQKLEEHVDHMVFRAWANDEPIVSPVYQLPTIQDSYVRVGVLKKALPTRATTAQTMAEALEHEVIGTSKSYYDSRPSSERKAGQPAYMRAKMDSLKQSIVHEFFDKKGGPVPVSVIDFGTKDNMPSEAKLFQAYNIADTAWAKACDSWNSKLCVHLCRRKIFDLSHTSPYDPERHGQRSYSEEDFIFTPRICTKIPWILDRHRALGIFVDDKEIRGPDGLAVFTGPVSRGASTYEGNANDPVKLEN